MKRNSLFSLLVAFSLLLGLAPSAPAAQGRRNNAASPAAAPAREASPTEGFDAFQLVVERNIFNPNRVGRARVTPTEKPVRVDEIALVGTVQLGGEAIAVFNSPDQAFRKDLRAGETLGEFKLQTVFADGVEMQRGDQSLTLKVAQQLRRVEGKDWAVSAYQAPKAGASTPSSSSTFSGRSSTSRSSAPPPPVVIPADASEALKRLMKKRESQLK